MATFATPGTAISRGRTVHRTIVVISVWDMVADVIPIFINRLSDDNGDNITGERALTGSWAAMVPSRSCTCWRAAMRSASPSRIKTTEDNPRTDLERMVFTPGTPASALSTGTLISDSTSGVDKPGASVWISTRGGANSGNTSSGMLRAPRAAASVPITAKASTTTACRNDRDTSQRMLLARPELGAE